MRLITPTDPEQPRPETEGNESAPRRAGDGPVSFVPHDENGATGRPPVRIRTGRYGEIDEHELIHLLDSIEDERARSRFRESIYISLFIWIAIAWLVLYGPRYLWHAPKLVTPFEVLKERELTQLNLPQLHAPPPSVPRAQPKIDNHTLEHLRSMEPPAKAAPPPPAVAANPKIAPTPAPSITNAAPPVPSPALPLPNAPQPTPRSAPPVVGEAPTPQPSTRPNFNAPNNPESSMNVGRGRGEDYGAPRGGGSSPLSFGKDVEILSDQQGVDFNPYIRRILADIRRNWIPLIPEECRPPLSKQGEVLIRFSILPDGRIGLPNGQQGGMWLDGSTHDDAINRSAWGSITSEGQFPPLPKEFHGPNLELRIHYYVNKPVE
ncbi:MAG TPA: energy transducer TonB [Acidobacteriaceae bacterium]|nr:energy transducer TonB [Acidobacteriaceae bacterium]